MELAGSKITLCVRKRQRRFYRGHRQVSKVLLTAAHLREAVSLATHGLRDVAVLRDVL